MFPWLIGAGVVWILSHMDDEVIDVVNPAPIDPETKPKKVRGKKRKKNV